MKTGGCESFGEGDARAVKTLLTIDEPDEKRICGVLAGLESSFQSRLKEETQDAIAILEILVLNGSELVRKAIAKSGPLAFAPELLEMLASDPRPSVRASLASNYRIAFHDDLIDKLSNDVPQVRETLESNDMIKSLLSSYT